jgi:hypothetical protein
MKDEIVSHLGKDSRQRVGVKNDMRYNDMWRIGFGKDQIEERYLAVFDGKKMFKRENKILEVSSEKSYTCEQCVYLDSLLWPFTDDHVLQLEKQPSESLLLPYLLAPKKDWEVSEVDSLVRMHNNTKGRTLVFDPAKNMAMLSFSLSKDATPSGFGRSKTVLSDYRDVNGVWLPFKIEAKSEVNKFQSKEIGGEISTVISVSDLKINEDVPDSIFHLAQLPGETTFDRVGGFVSSPTPMATEESIESVVASIQASRTSRKKKWTYFLIPIAFFIIGFALRLWRKPQKTPKAMILLIVFGSHAFVGASHGQEESAKYFVLSHRVSFQLRHNQAISPFFEPEGQFFTPLPLLKLIENNEVFEELESVDYQRSDVTDAISKLETAIEEYKATREKWELTPKVEEKIFRRPIDNGNKILASVFLPHQKERMGQILQQFELSRLGIVGALAYGNVGRSLPLSKAELAEFEKISLAKFDKWNEQISEMKQDYFRKVTKPLTSSQKKYVESLLPKNVDDAPLFLTVARASKHYSENLTQYVDLELPAIFEAYRPFLLKNGFDIGVTGEVTPKTFALENPQRKIHIMFLQLFNSSKSSEYFELSDEQAQELSSLDRDWNIAKNKWTEDYGRFEGSDDEYKAKWKKIFSKLRVNHIERIQLLLDKQQKEKLAEVTFKTEIRCFGLQNSLTLGELGKKLKLTKDQKEQVRAASVKTAKSIRSKLIAMEKEWIEMFEGFLDESKREGYTGVIGDKLELSQGNIELHMLIQSSPMRSDILPALVEQANVDLATSLMLPTEIQEK